MWVEVVINLAGSSGGGGVMLGLCSPLSGVFFILMGVGHDYEGRGNSSNF